MNEVLPGEIAEAVTWFRTMVPQRTMHNWQNQGAALIADILLERERSLAAENSQ